MEQKKYRHYVSMDLYGNGIAHDILIVKEDHDNGDVYFIKVSELDSIDQARMRQILTKRNANTMPLWDVMSQVTLKNGENALTYFHQMVKVRTSSGQIISPSAARRGVVNIRKAAAKPTQQPLADNKVTEPVKAQTRGPGRPKKKKD